jgi:N-acetylglucosamine kinase-like BadF-type ATPase
VSGPLYLGVDGGNTKTVALVATADGLVHGSGRAGCSDIYATGGANEATRAIDAAVGAALADAGATRDDVVCACFSLAGADWPEDFAYHERTLARHAKRIRVVNDGIGALWAGAVSGPAVSVVCGTGAAVGARGADGRLWHSSFWQTAQGARDLGRHTWFAVIRSELGIDPPTGLRGRLAAIANAPDIDSLLHRYTRRDRREAPPYERFTQALVAEAARGDSVAVALMRAHADVLGDYALAAARQVQIGDAPFALVLAGGVVRASGVLHDAIVARVRERANAVPVDAPLEPVAGAVLLALESAGGRPDGDVVARLAESAGPAPVASGATR